MGEENPPPATNDTNELRPTHDNPNTPQIEHSGDDRQGPGEIEDDIQDPIEDDIEDDIQ